MLTLIAAMIAAEPVPAKISLDEMCPALGSAAHSVMKARQANAPLSMVMNAILEASDKNSDIYRALVLDAYQEIAFADERNKMRAAYEFQSKWEMACYEGHLDFQS